MRLVLWQGVHNSLAESREEGMDGAARWSQLRYRVEKAGGAAEVLTGACLRAELQSVRVPPTESSGMNLN